MDKDTYSLFRLSKEYELWPIEEQKFMDILYGTKDINNETKVITEEIEGSVIGFVSVKLKGNGEEKHGSIVFLFIDERHRAKGTGKKLLTKGISWLRDRGVNDIKCGGTAGSYFYPGIPENLNVTSFFVKNGFGLTDGMVVDMYQDITNFEPPKNVYFPLKEWGITIEYANEKYSGRISSFVKQNFPKWSDYYQESQISENPKHYFFAHKNDEIIAISTLWAGGNTWDMLFENNVGGGGALGVSENWRGKGIGLAMKCWGTEKIQKIGIKYVYVGWTDSIGFYEKLGFKVWRSYFNNRLIINQAE